jgi:hypothetical protein
MVFLHVAVDLEMWMSTVSIGFYVLIFLAIDV